MLTHDDNLVDRSFKKVKQRDAEGKIFERSRLCDVTACKYSVFKRYWSEIFREEIHRRATRRQLELKMVAGMVMPLADLRAIYELLFRDGVLVAKKDKHPQSMHPEVKGVSNLKVIRAMASLKSKGCVRETFAWKHAYYYITNEGVAYLRNYLHLPPEIMPASLQRVWRPAFSARVHTAKDQTPHIPKPKPGRESQEAMMERHIYHHKRAGEERGQSERPPKTFKGSYVSVGQPGVQTPTFFKRDKDFSKGEECLAKQGNWKSSVKDAKLPVSLVPSTSIAEKFSKEMPTVHPGLCASVKEVRQKCVKMTAVDPSAASKESECVRIQEATIKEPKEDLTPDVMRAESSNLALEVLGEVVPEFEPGERVVADRQTIPLLAELTEKEEQQDVKDEGCVLEEADVVTKDTAEIYDVKMMKQLNVEVFNTVTKTKIHKLDPDHDSATLASTATDNFRDLTEKKVVDHNIADIDGIQKVMEKTIPMKPIYEFHVASEIPSSTAFEAGCPGPVVPSEGPVAALKTTLLQEDQNYLTEDPEDVQRSWHDVLEGLSLA